MAKATTNLDDDKARPKGDTGDGDTGVPANEQGISNRPGDADDQREDDNADDLEETGDEERESGS